jgi:SAM-dependent methyltransferase
VVGIDFSHGFIGAAETLRERGELPYERLEEGGRTTPAVARVPTGIARERVRFSVGDALHLPDTLGQFEVVLMANLIDRLSDPLACLRRLGSLVRPGGQLIVTSPYTWLEEYTPRERWLAGATGSTVDGLKRALNPDFELRGRRDLPFLIREHARKFQWSVAEASCWVRR